MLISGKYVTVAVIFLNVVLWTIFPPSFDGAHTHGLRQYVGEALGSTLMMLLAVTLLLSTRLRLLEPLFGGLDKMYAAHRVTGTAAILLLPLHFLLMPFLEAPVPPGRAPGYIAFGGLLIFTLLTVAPRIPLVRRVIRLGYRGWRITHKFIGIFFIMGTAHMLLVDTLVRTTVVPFSLLMVAVVVGIASYLYTELLAGLLRPKARYEVKRVNRLNAKVAEVVLRPVKKSIRYMAGQFVFVRFKGGGRKLSEPHPFTVSSAPGETQLRLTVAVAGDFTERLYSQLQIGLLAVVEGGYGRLDYRQGGPEQIWVAAGIGVTPFLSWIRDMARQRMDRRIDFYYTVRSAEEALFVNELLEAEQAHFNLRVHIVYSSEQGRLTMTRIRATTNGNLADKQIYMCGPSAMLKAFRDEFRRAGVSARAIHYERFQFR